MLVGTSGSDTITGGTGDDTLIGGSNSTSDPDDPNATDYLYGGDGNDTLIGSSMGMNYLYGGAGNDTLIGSSAYTFTGATTYFYGSTDTKNIDTFISGYVSGEYGVNNATNYMILGSDDGTQVYYLGVDSYAIIEVNPNDYPVFQLAGTPNDYLFESDPTIANASRLYYVKNGSHDLIAKINRNYTNTILDPANGSFYYPQLYEHNI